MTDYPRVLLYNNALHEFNPSRVQYSAPKKTAHGSYVITTLYPLPSGEKVPVVIQTPRMVTCFGVNLSDRDGQNKAGIDLAFMDSAPSDVQAFKAVMEEWDRLLVQTAKANRAAWFRSEKVSDSIIDYLYCPCVRPNIRKSDGQRFADTMRPKIKRRTDNGTDKLGLDAFDDAGAPIDPLTIGPKSEVRVIVTQTGIWISESMFVCSFEAVQAQLLGKPQLAGFGFVDAHSAPSSPSEKESDIA